MKKLHSSTLRLVYPDLENPEYLKVIVYRDATHASLPSGASQGAQMGLLCGNNRAVPITYKSKKLESVTESPMRSETMVLAQSADAGHFVTSMTKEIFGLKMVPRVFCKTNDKSLEEHLKSSKVIQDLRLRVDIARLREMVKIDEIEVQSVDKINQLAGPLTKYGASAVCLMDVLKCGKL